MILALYVVSSGRLVQGTAEESWVRTPTGFEQSWVVATDPGVPLRIDVPIDAVVVRHGAGLRFVDKAGQAWTVRPAEAWDADGRPLPSHMGPTTGGYTIAVDTAGARWPVTVDPFYDAGALELDMASIYGAPASAAAYGDVNGDGFGDLTMGNGDALGVWFGTAHGPGATADVSYDITPLNGVNWVAGVGDVDGDGRDDVAAVATDQLGVWHGSGSGLVPGDVVPLDWGDATLHPVGDLDGDGQQDLLAADTYQASGFAAPLYGDGAGFRLGAEFDLPSHREDGWETTPDYYAWLIDGAGDANQDGYDDFVVESESDDDAVILAWWGSATGPTEEWDQEWHTGAGGWSVANLGDVDGDGFPDLAWTWWESLDEQRVVWAFGDGDGWDVEHATELIAPEDVYSWGRLDAAGDLDGDGTPDLLAAAYRYDGNRFTVEPWVWLGGEDGFAQDRVELGQGIDDVNGYLSWAGDLDGDGNASVLVFGDPGENWLVDWGPEEDPDGDGDGASTDCAPNDPDVGPSTPETCDGIDDDCDGEVDEGPPPDAPSWETDADGDGFGVPPARQDCLADADEVPAGGTPDCDDEAEWRSPEAVERCNGQDDDCDGEIDEGPPADAGEWLIDVDGDGYGAGSPVWTCDPPEGWVPAGVGTDCDDMDPTIHPDAQEVDGNDVDEDCDGQPVATQNKEPGTCQAVHAPVGWILLAAGIAAARRARHDTKARRLMAARP